MKNLKIFFLVCIAQVANSYGMEREQISFWSFLPEDNVISIVACSDLNTKENLRLVNKQLFDIACKNKIEIMLYYFPCVLSRQDHLDCMVKYAKNNNKDMVLRLMRTARYCNHADLLEVVPYFLPKDAHELILLKEYDAFCPNENAMQELPPCVMAVYGGDKKALEQYMINYMEIQYYQSLYDYCSGKNKITLQEYKDKITPLHIATLRKHPISIAQLLLTQDSNLLNAVDHHGCTPLFGAVRLNAVEMCRFLLSYKNINPNKEDKERTIPLLLATMYGYFEIVELLTNYNNTHNIQLKDYPFPLWAQEISSDDQDAIKRFLLDPANCQLSELMDALRHTCRYGRPDTLEIFFEFYHANIDINVQYNDDKDFTLLHYAAIRPHLGLVEFLLSKGSDLDIVDAEGKKAIDVAKSDVIKEVLLAKMKHG